ncbi:LLM class flavin-dependent oxidoreductase [Rhodococcus rhodochrous]|uniref:LLM class flavin-dependent oxidoreductase n=1 Tax=Rhodococcus rhodochrous TaxID=1829 RepID=A0AAW4XNU1_RHORH|nr:LLM class flavin-dependent oxidoreductase [Rhodococcus rhodochrous]MCD2114569.1 LLM class flavin-dependent oxidoreductase [Rhodococcus rhodochrous]
MTELKNIPISVLDLALREHGQSNADAVHAAVENAQVAERLGYARYWFAAHHGLPNSTASQPPILIGAAANATTTLRVGSGPVLLPIYSPLAVAEQFGTLTALYGNRIDLGLGRSSGGFPARAIRGPRGAASHSQDVLDLLGLFQGGLPPDNPMSQVVAVPGYGDTPETWLLGSTSGYSAQLAGELGLPFAYAHHFAPERTEEILDVYRGAFRPSWCLEEPHVMVTTILVAADNPESVRAESMTSDITHLALLKGERPEPVNVDEALARRFSAQEERALAKHHARQAIGTPDEVEAQLRTLLASTGADELMFQLVASTAAGRVRSLEIAKHLTM